MNAHLLLLKGQFILNLQGSIAEASFDPKEATTCRIMAETEKTQSGVQIGRAADLYPLLGSRKVNIQSSSSYTETGKTQYGVQIGRAADLYPLLDFQKIKQS